MAENLFFADIGDTRLTAVFFDESLCMRRADDPQWSLVRIKNLHQHSTYEVFFGARISIVTEERTLDCGNSLIVIPPYMNHYTNVGDGKTYAMYFDIERNAKRQGILFDVLEKTLSGAITVLPLTEDEKFYISHIASASCEDTSHLISLLFSEIFSRLAPKLSDSTARGGKREKYIKKIDSYIADHYGENITLADLSRELYLCEKQISRVIAREYDCSLSELVTRRRLSVSCMLLKYTTMPIGEIARQIGYANENYFFSVFKKEYGTTPKKYRNESK